MKKPKKKRTFKFHCHKVRVGDAGIKGRGVFALAEIAKGEGIELSPAMPIAGRDTSRIDGTLLGHYTFMTGRGVELLGLGYVSLYNHSFTPNAAFVLMPDAILIVALRRIETGEEIEFDYGWSKEAFRATGIDVPANAPLD